VGRLDDSKEQAEAALKINRLYLPARDLLGSIYTKKGDRKAAEAAMRDAKPQSENKFKIELAKRCLTHALQMAATI